MTPLWESLKKITDELSSISDNPRFEAELLLSQSLNISRAELLVKIKENIKIPPIVEDWVQRRRKHEPLAYILGFTEFFGLKIKTSPPIFIPRPETELLVEKSLELIEKGGKDKVRILELCTGTGCISIAIAKNIRKETNIFALDINHEAVELAQDNAKMNEVNIYFIVADLFQSLNRKEKYDLIVANPPYISENDREKLPPTVKDFEDSKALFSKDNGLDIIKHIIQESIYYLHKGGYLLMEIGENQNDNVENLLSTNNYEEINTLLDLQSLPRVVIGKWNY